MRRSLSGGTAIIASMSLAAACAAVAGGIGAPVAAAKNGDTHIYNINSVVTIDCNNATVFVNGSGNTVNALGSCWAVTTQGSDNTVIADNVVNDITVYGFNNSVMYKSGDPFIWDRGRELGMTNIISRIPG